MIFFDPKNPNKYKDLKKELVPFSIEGYVKTKVGRGDGGYVIDHRNVDTVLSYGIGDDPEGISFEEEMLKMGCEVHMYDGSIAFLPKKVEGGISKFKSEFVTAENFKEHVEELPPRPLFNCVLKMDIEGNEYDWATFENIKLAAKTFGQLTIEVHSLIEEVPQGWELEPQLAEAKKDREKVLSFFKNINKHFVLWHMHGNNHAPTYVDFPDSLELTYINRKAMTIFSKEKEAFPIDGLDEPNYDLREDYVLDWWL